MFNPGVDGSQDFLFTDFRATNPLSGETQQAEDVPIPAARNDNEHPAG